MFRTSLVLSIGLFSLGCATIEEEIEIPLEEVPAVVMEAAQGAVDGIVFEEAEIEMEDGVKVYELEGVADGVEYEIEVSESGEVLEVEEQEEDEEEEAYPSS